MWAAMARQAMLMPWRGRRTVSGLARAMRIQLRRQLLGPGAAGGRVWMVPLRQAHPLCEGVAFWRPRHFSSSASETIKGSGGGGGGGGGDDDDDDDDDLLSLGATLVYAGLAPKTPLRIIRPWHFLERDRRVSRHRSNLDPSLFCHRLLDTTCSGLLVPPLSSYSVTPRLLSPTAERGENV